MGSLTHEDYTVGWICALDVELTASMAMIDEEHPSLPQPIADSNSYSLCRICKHNVVLACLPSGQTGNNSAASVAARMTLLFPSIRFGIMVGVGGGAPGVDKNGKVVVDIRLGDVVVSNPGPKGGGVLQYDFGKTVKEGKFVHTGTLNHPPKVVLTALQTIKAKHRFRRFGFLEYLAQIPPKLGETYAYLRADRDRLFEAKYEHHDNADNCDSCDRNKLVNREPRGNSNPIVHYGIIASGNEVMRHGTTRERLQREHEIMCFEMEAAGLVNEFPCVVIRGICDYSDSHKNKDWQPYAAATAAAYAKELLSVVPVGHAFSVASAAAVGSVSSSRPQSVTASPISPTMPSSQSSSPKDVCHTDNAVLPGFPAPASPLRLSAVGRNLVQFLTSAFTVVSDSFLPWNRAALGRLVLNIDDPGQDYCPHIPFAVSLDEISVKNFQNSSEVFDIGGESPIAQRFKRFFSPIGSDGRQERSVYNLTARGAVTHQLLNSGDFFDRLLQDENTKRWIEKSKHEGKKDVYLIVGIHALLNFEVNVSFGSKQSADSSNSTMSTQSERSNGKTLKIGDRIIGVQYRRVRVQGWNSKAAGSLFVDKKSWWKKYYRLDLLRTVDNLEVDILTAELDETPDISDIREDIPAEWEMDVCRSDISGEDFVFLVESLLSGQC